MKKVLIIGAVWPEPKSSAAGSRMMRLIHFFKEAGFQVVFATATQPSGFEEDLKAQQLEVENIVLNDSSFDDFIQGLAPEVVMFDRFLMEEQYGWRVRACCPSALSILDTEDLHSLRRARQKAVESGVVFGLEDWKQKEDTLRELASIYRSDVALIVSEYEMRLLKTEFQWSTDSLYYLPLLIDQVPLSSEFVPFGARKDFVTIGNFYHKPNLDAVRYLKSEIWPLIRKQLPKASLHIYGAYPTPKVTQLHQPKDGFLVHGRADSVRQVMSSGRVCLAPLRFGAGLKGKFFDAMKSGTPSVTTSLGLEGISDPENWAGAVADHPQSIADAAVKLHEHQEHWNAAQNKIPPILERFKAADFYAHWHRDLQDRLENLSTSRKQNFIGAMLHHHTMSSSKYFSKWIEEKNKKP